MLAGATPIAFAVAASPYGVKKGNPSFLHFGEMQRRKAQARRRTSAKKRRKTYGRRQRGRAGEFPCPGRAIAPLFATVTQYAKARA